MCVSERAECSRPHDYSGHQSLICTNKHTNTGSDHTWILGLIKPFATLINAVIQRRNILKNESSCIACECALAEEVAGSCFSSKYEGVLLVPCKINGISPASAQT